MAYSKSKQYSEHAFIRIGRELKNEQIPNVLFLYGTETFLVDWAVEELVKKYVNPVTKTMDYTVFPKGEFTLEKAREALETVPMFSQRKVVLLEDFQPIWGKEKKLLSEKEGSELIACINNLPQQVLLVMTAGKQPDELKKRAGSELFKAVKACGGVYDFEPLGEADLKKFILKRFTGAGKQISGSTLNTLMVQSGYYNNEIDYGLYNLDNDIKKIIALSGVEVQKEDVLLGISDNLEHNTFKLLDAVSNNRKSEAFRLLHELLAGGESGFRLLAGIIGQLELMLQVREMRGEGMSLGEIQKTLKIHEFRIKKAMGFAEKYTPGDLRRVLQSAFAVETQIKTGLLKEDMALEMLIAEV